MTSSEDLGRRLVLRFRCNCGFHASFNFSDFTLSENYFCPVRWVEPNYCDFEVGQLQV